MKLLSWKSVQGWVENLSNCVAQHNWTDVQLKIGKCLDRSSTLQHIYIYIELHAYNLIWWAVLRFQDDWNRGREEESRGKRTENRRKEKGQNMEEHPPFRGYFYFKIGEILRFWNQTCPPGEVWAIYIYICWRAISLSTFKDLLRVIRLATSKVSSLSTFWGAIFALKKYVSDFCVEFWSKLVCSSPFSQISHLVFEYLLFSNFPKPLFLKRPFLRKNAKSVVQKKSIK